MNFHKPNVKIRWLCLALAIATFLTFSRGLTCDFVSYDDEGYVTKNLDVKQGVTLSGIKCAFTRIVGGNWHPVTMLSHMLDCQVYGLRPWGHHLTSILLHSVNSVLVLLLLYCSTGAVWRSAAVAALFALHPLRVESVVWIAERKDVLSAFFGLLTILSYLHYVGEGAANRPKARIWYAVALLMFVLGIMSKPMLVTWPFVLILLDVWPLHRLSLPWLPKNPALPSPSLRRVVCEKIPFFFVTVIFCLVTISTQFAQVPETQVQTPLVERIENAGVAYAQYLSKTVWPTHLAVLYPHPGQWPEGMVVLSFGLILLLTGAVLVAMRRRSWLGIGWFWFLGTLVPVIGLVQVGYQFMADRYSYLPHIGLFVALVWLTAEVVTRASLNRFVVTAVATSILVALAGVTWKQTGYWRSSDALFARALAVTSGNAIAHFNYAIALSELNRPEEMGEHYRSAVEIWPGFHAARMSLGQHLCNIGDYEGATNQLGYALRFLTNYPLGNYFMAKAQAALGDFGPANDNFALALTATNGVPVHSDWAKALMRAGQPAAAIEQFDAALKTEGESADIHANLAAAFVTSRDYAAAISHYHTAIRLKPDAAELQNNLAWLLATCPEDSVRNGPEAVRLAQRACELTENKQPITHGTLAAAYAESGNFTQAQAAATAAINLAAQAGLTNVVEKNRELLALFKNGKPFREMK